MGKEPKTVCFQKDLIKVHYIPTYKKWNYRQYMFVCANLSYFDGE